MQKVILVLLFLLTGSISLFSDMIDDETYDKNSKDMSKLFLNVVYTRPYEETGGVFLTTNYKNGARNGETILYYPDSKTILLKGNYINDKKEGIWSVYNEDGLLVKTENYKDNLLDGEQIQYYPNGNKYSVTMFNSGKKEGVERLYYLSGALSSEFYNKNDKRDGDMILYYPSGKIYIKRTFTTKKSEEMITYYYEEGGKFLEGFVKDDKYKIKEWKYYDKNGNILSQGDGEKVLEASKEVFIKNFEKVNLLTN